MHADGGIAAHDYDAFGNEISQRDARGYITRYIYDRINRRLESRVDGAPVQAMRYDEAGRVTAASNRAGDTTAYRYDLRGNVVEVIQPMGQRTRYAYDAHNRQTAITDALNRTVTWTYDDFGQLLGHTDIGGAVYTYRYDAARQLIEQRNSRGQHRLYGFDAAGRQIRIDDVATGKLTEYRVDALGNHLVERTTQNGEVLQNNQLRYDSNGRLTEITDTAAGLVRITIGYDANGNRRRIATDIEAAGASQHSVDWYAYDAMNRQTIVNATEAQAMLGKQGQSIAYDLNGNRISDT